MIGRDEIKSIVKEAFAGSDTESIVTEAFTESDIKSLVREAFANSDIKSLEKEAFVESDVLGSLTKDIQVMKADLQEPYASRELWVRRRRRRVIGVSSLRARGG